MAKTAQAPDYQAAAQQQAQSSREVTEQQTWANRPTQQTPFGSQYWDSTPTWDPATGQYLNQWTQHTELNPTTQGALESQQNLTKNRSDLGNALFPRAAQEFGNAMDWSQFQKGGDSISPWYVDGGQSYYDKAGDAVMDQFNRRMEPQFQESQAQLDTTLRNRGLKPGDAAYDNELSKLRTQQGDQRQNAMSEATKMAGSEAQRMFGMNSSASAQNFGQEKSSSEFQTQQRQQQIAEEMQRRGFSLNEINALISGQQVGMPNMPSFSNAQRSDATQYMQAAQNQYSADADKANAQNALMNSVVQGGMSMI